MLSVFKEGLLGYKYLLNFKDYRRSESVIKYFWLILVLPLFTIFFLATSLFYLIERLFAPAFKYFLVFQMKMIQKRNFAKNDWSRRGVNLLTFLVTIAALPFVIIYFLSTLLKALMKYLMRVLIIKLDYSIQFNQATVQIFDDKVKAAQSPIHSMMQDAKQSEGLGKALEDMFNQNANLMEDNSDIVDAFDEDDNKQ